MKNCDQGLENAARGRRPRAAFSRPRSQFFTIVGLHNFVIELAGLKCRLRTIVKSRTCEQTSDLDKERCIKEQIYFELLYDRCI